MADLHGTPATRLPPDGWTGARDPNSGAARAPSRTPRRPAVCLAPRRRRAHNPRPVPPAPTGVRAVSDILESTPAELTSLPLIYRGKVRDVYGIDDRHILIVATDRLSAFDVVLPTGIPGKGAMLTAISNFWFERTRQIVPNHLDLATVTLEQALPDPAERARVEGRAVVARKLRGLPVEAIVRGYLIGSGWKDYRTSGAVCGIALPAGLRLAERLPEPIFTPSTKAAVGDHDENVSYEAVVAQIGAGLAAHSSDTSAAPSTCSMALRRSARHGAQYSATRQPATSRASASRRSSNGSSSDGKFMEAPAWPDGRSARHASDAPSPRWMDRRPRPEFRGGPCTVTDATPAGGVLGTPTAARAQSAPCSARPDRSPRRERHPRIHPGRADQPAADLPRQGPRCLRHR
ncbi:MAG: hypothetical protein EKK65_09290 [Lysobacterales bacterium]|nr:MAG: hypothetical protein EKK65_09290 [Xanthomonadales bacterium]